MNLVYNSMAEKREREGRDSLEDEDDRYDPLLDDIDLYTMMEEESSGIGEARASRPQDEGGCGNPGEASNP